MSCNLCSLRHLALLAFVSLGVLGRQVDPKLGFGEEKPITPDYTSPPKGWNLQGDPHSPKIHSDRIVLTPPYPGKERAALWAENKNTHLEWTASLEFRANGPEGGDGNLHIWYEREGRTRVGTSSIYTIDKFDGLALVVDAYGGKGGSIRAFLNDGTIDYKTANVDSLAFGHCNYQYRNLGRPTKIKLAQASDHLRLEVDDWTCFTSKSVKLPQDYYFGITAASASTPDSFEVFSFALSSDVPVGGSGQQQQQQQQQPPTHQDTSDIQHQTQQKQFLQLSERIDELTRMVSKLQDETSKLSESSAHSREELSKSRTSIDRLGQLHIKLETIERVVYAIKDDIEGRDYRGLLTALEQTVRDHHSSLMMNLPQTMGHIVTSAVPKMGVIVLLVLASQAVLLGGYIMYKRRLKMQPKKYL
ncbi:MAG: hypothetical protein M1813_003384 [Trichoglossum hirsutum]|nr:MAG: hypothetical protein M1813_003384 [Trichoglossum hirsutum]